MATFATARIRQRISLVLFLIQATFAGGYDNLPWFLHRIPLFDTCVELDPIAALMVVLVTVLLCYGIKEVRHATLSLNFSSSY